jgi:hypothetical protein
MVNLLDFNIEHYCLTGWTPHRTYNIENFEGKGLFVWCWDNYTHCKIELGKFPNIYEALQAANAHYQQH